MPHPLLELVQRDWPLDRWHDMTILVGVSGGADSMALLRVLHTLQPQRIEVGHFNHHWRGDESDQDSEFVARSAAQLGVPCHQGETSSAARDEASARDARYAFLTRTAERIGARYVALAHTQGDQVETILHRILRGTGLRGLSGIPRFRRSSPAVTLVRPLLDCPRAMVLDYLTAISQDYRDDSSNADCGYTRNRIRLELLPLLAAAYNPRVDEALLRLATQSQETQAWVSDYARTWFAPAVMVPSSGQVQLDLRRIAMPATGRAFLVREALLELWREQAWPQQAMTADHWQQLANWLVSRSDPNQRELPGVTVVRIGPDQYRLTARPGDRDVAVATL